MPNVCCACGATKPVASDNTIHFYRFPKSPERSYAWLKQLNLIDVKVSLNHSLVCSRHFSDEQYELNSADSAKRSVGRRLKSDACPDVRVIQLEDEFLSIDKSCIKKVMAPPIETNTPATASPKRNVEFRYLGDINEERLDCSKEVQDAFRVLKKSIQDTKAKMNSCTARNARLLKQNLLLKETIKRTHGDDCVSGDIVEELFEKDLKEEQLKPIADRFEYKPKVSGPTKKLTLDWLGKISCRLCLGTKSGTQQRSAFGSFAGENFLSDVIWVCFGVVIKEDDFCTEVCEQCLVKVDLTWRMFKTVQSNSQALDVFFRSLKNETKPVIVEAKPAPKKPPISKIASKVTTKKSRRKLASKLTTAEGENSDQDGDDSLDSSRRMSIEFETKPAIAETKASSKMASRSTTAESEDSDQDIDDSLGSCSRMSIESEPFDSSNGDDDSYSLPEHPFFTDFSTSVYLCHLCPLQFEKAQPLHFHLSAAHPVEDENTLCHYCCKFIHQNALRKHLKSHEDPKPVCEVCAQCFSNEANLRRHMLIHTNEKPYACMQCEAAFNQSTLLKLHVRKVHLGIKLSYAKKPGKTRKPKKLPKKDKSNIIEISD
ncbi:putative zinc finger protein 286B [Topomyia yanbarensis]|uniref:putative zinc finger protein 286B n=1 Tax=Topomyia yanbarensis TaxID=2498891 RepID=UPI00273C5462|nr:putative zinc finger protein 286B [Topomyia yanbarensis]XP_058822403.1 putative zinc finger protein 286B [Topomyia yanbarensis]